MNSTQIGGLIRSIAMPLLGALGVYLHLSGSMVGLICDAVVAVGVMGWSIFSKTDTAIISSAAQVVTPSGALTQIQTTPSIAAALGPNVTAKQ